MLRRRLQLVMLIRSLGMARAGTLLLRKVLALWMNITMPLHPPRLQALPTLLDLKGRQAHIRMPLQITPLHHAGSKAGIRRRRLRIPPRLHHRHYRTTSIWLQEPTRTHTLLPVAIMGIQLEGHHTTLLRVLTVNNPHHTRNTTTTTRLSPNLKHHTTPNPLSTLMFTTALPF